MEKTHEKEYRINHSKNVKAGILINKGFRLSYLLGIYIVGVFLKITITIPLSETNEKENRCILRLNLLQKTPFSGFCLPKGRNMVIIKRFIIL